MTAPLRRPISISCWADKIHDQMESRLVMHAVESGGVNELYQWLGTVHCTVEKATELAASLSLAPVLIEDGDIYKHGAKAFRRVWMSSVTYMAVECDSWAKPVALRVRCGSLHADVIERVKSFEGFAVKPILSGSLHVVSFDHGDLDLSPLGALHTPLVRDNYDERVLAGYDLAKTSIVDGDRGRFVLLVGPPGTGKSYLLRSLVNEIDALHLIVPESMFSKLTDPGFLKALAQKHESDRAIVLMMEDADSVIQPRGSDNIGALSTLLNVTDGLLGTMLNLRVVATTNAKRAQIEPALLRPGRLAARIDCEPLTAEHAGRVFSRLTNGGSRTPGPATLAQLYAEAAALK